MSGTLLDHLIAEAWTHQQRCQGCRDCLEVCPVLDETLVSAGGLLRAMEAPDAMSAAERQFAADCTLCGQCVPACPTGARRDIMTHGLKFAAFSKSQSAPRHDFPRLWWEGLQRDVKRLGEGRRLGRLGPLLDRDVIPHARRLLWIGAAAAASPELAVSLFDFCGVLVDSIELVAGESYPSGRAWIAGNGEAVEQAAAEFLELCREMEVEEIICAEDHDAVFFSRVLEQCEPEERPAAHVCTLADWLGLQGSRLRWRDACARALYLPATLRDENAKRFRPRFYGDDLVRNYALLGFPKTLSDGHTAVDPESQRVAQLPGLMLRHMRGEAHRVLVVETFSEAVRLSAQARREGGATVLLLHEALEFVPDAARHAQEEALEPIAEPERRALEGVAPDWEVPEEIELPAPSHEDPLIPEELEEESLPDRPDVAGSY